MAERQDTAPSNFALQLLGVALLGVAGSPFLPWERAARGGSTSLVEQAPTVAVVVVPVMAFAAFLAFSEHITAIGVGLVAGLAAVPYGLSAVLRTDTTGVDTAGDLTASIGPWVLLLAGVGALLSSIAAFVVARRSF